MTKPQGITLAELLIALGIVALIAVFAIPKVLSTMTGNNNAEYQKAGLQTIADIQAAYNQFRADQRPSGTTTFDDVKEYMNYVRIDSAGTHKIDRYTGGTYYTCDQWQPCVVLPNGSYIYYYYSKNFGGTTTSNGFYVYIDPDGEYSGAADGPGKSVQIFLYYDGKIRTRENILNPTEDGDFSGYTPDSNADPDWFSWD